MRCPICNEEVANTEQAEQWGPEWAHSRCVIAYNYGKADAAPEAPAQGDPLEKLTQIQEELGLYNDKPAQADMGNPISVPAPWREAVKVAREALIDAKTFVGAWPAGAAALAQLDRLEGRE